MNVFLRPIIDELNQLSTDGGLPVCICCNNLIVFVIGILVDTPAGAMVARAAVLMCSVDLPARALVTNMKQWNGAHGCLYCKDPGVTLGSDHLHRYWPYQQSSTLRSRASLLSNAEEAIRTGNTVCMLFIEPITKHF